VLPGPALCVGRLSAKAGSASFGCLQRLMSTSRRTFAEGASSVPSADTRLRSRPMLARAHNGLTLSPRSDWPVQPLLDLDPVDPKQERMLGIQQLAACRVYRKQAPWAPAGRNGRNFEHNRAIGGSATPVCHRRTERAASELQRQGSAADAGSDRTAYAVEGRPVIHRIPGEIGRNDAPSSHSSSSKSASTPPSPQLVVGEGVARVGNLYPPGQRPVLLGHAVRVLAVDPLMRGAARRDQEHKKTKPRARLMRSERVDRSRRFMACYLTGEKRNRFHSVNTCFSTLEGERVVNTGRQNDREAMTAFTRGNIICPALLSGALLTAAAHAEGNRGHHQSGSSERLMSGPLRR